MCTKDKGSKVRKGLRHSNHLKNSPLPLQMFTAVSPQAWGAGGLADCGFLYSVGPRETSLLGTQEGT